MPAGAYCCACSPPPTGTPGSRVPMCIRPHLSSSLTAPKAHTQQMHVQQLVPFPSSQLLRGVSDSAISVSICPTSHLPFKLPTSTHSRRTCIMVLPLPGAAARSLLPDALERSREEVLHVVHDGAAQLLLRRDHGDVLGQVPARACSALKACTCARLHGDCARLLCGQQALLGAPAQGLTADLGPSAST